MLENLFEEVGDDGQKCAGGKRLNHSVFEYDRLEKTGKT